MTEALLEVEDLRKYFPIRGGVLKRRVGSVKAVDGVSFKIRRGETFGVVGESGCGKTTLGRCLLRLIEPSGGRIYINVSEQIHDGAGGAAKTPPPSTKDTPMSSTGSIDLLSLKPEEMRRMRRHMQIVFQDPMSSLNPRMLVKDAVGEPLVINGVAKGMDLFERAAELLEMVGLTRDHLFRYPHEFSGGQRQRICIARALALNPEFVVLDEPTSALDVSVQAQILNLLKRLQKELGLTYVFISHHLNVIRHMADRVAVMYLGKFVEVVDSETIFRSPLHPYPKALLSAIPSTDLDFEVEHVLLKGEVPSPSNPPLGCYFHPRCPEAFRDCGWEGRDLQDHLKTRLQGGGEDSYRDMIDVVEPDGFELNIYLRDDGDTAAFRGWIGDVIESGRRNKEPLFEAVEDIAVGERTPARGGPSRMAVTVRLVKAVEPELVEVKEGHFVACHRCKP